MAWTAPATTVADQLMTAAFWNEQIRDNQLALRAGGFAVASQASNDLLVASSGSQVGRLAAADGVPRYSGGAWSMISVREVMYPVGIVYVAVVSTNPNTLLGFGTWAALATGRILVGLSPSDSDFNVSEKTGGAKTVTLITAELPVHNHNPSDPGHNHQIGRDSAQGEGGYPQHGNPRNYPGTSTPDLSKLDVTGLVVQNTGGGGAHNNLPPYQVVYIWKRTA